MEFFICIQCGCIDTPTYSSKGHEQICSDCSGDGWHHFFSKEKFDRETHKNILTSIINLPGSSSEASFS